MMESGSAITSASSLSTLGWISSSPMDMRQSSWSTRSLTVSSWIVGGFVCSQAKTTRSESRLPGQRVKFSDLEMVEFRILRGMAVQIRSVQLSLIFKDCLIQAQEWSIPMNKKSIKGGRRPALMNRGPHKTQTIKRQHLRNGSSVRWNTETLSKHADVMGSRKPKLTLRCLLVEALKGNKEELDKYFSS